MTTLLDNTIVSTLIFTIIFLIVLLLSIKKKKDLDVFPHSLTQELKGFAMLTVIFAHIGYFLVNDHRFLFPLSIMSGVGVNLFLFLSGYGLVVAQRNKKLTLKEYYIKRLPRLYIPLWIALVIFLIIDFVFLKINYSWSYILQSFLGYFPSADIFTDINSPSWYITLILIYYLLFPLVYINGKVWISAIVLFVIGYVVVRLEPPVLSNVLHLYKVHILAFPLGMLFASWREVFSFFSKLLSVKMKDLLKKIFHWLKNMKVLYFILILLLIALVGYTAYYSNVGQGMFKEQLVSIVTMLAVVLLFLLKKIELRFLYILGVYSFEIYLLHWPILTRYINLYLYLPGWLATVLYMVLFIVLGFGLKKVADYIIHKITKS